MSTTLELPDVDINTTAFELGIFFMLSLSGEFLLFEQVSGNLSRLRQFLMNREFHLIKNPSLVKCVNGFLKVICYMFLLLPTLTLIVWGTMMINLAIRDDRKPIGGIAIILVGQAFNWFVYSIFKIRWHNYRLSKQTVICMFISFAFFISY